MRTTAILSVMALALMFTTALSAQDEAKPAAEEAKGVQWTQDYAKALETAKTEKKRLFIEFTATW